MTTHEAPATTSDRPKVLGRPRDAAADEAILAAAQALLVEGGMRAVTMSAVVRRSGVARATLYRRYPSRQPLVTAAIRRTMGLPALQPRGDLALDVEAGADLAQRILANPRLRPLLPALLEAVLAPAGDEGHLGFDEFAPGRQRFIARYQEELGPDAELAVDTFFGAVIGKLFITGRPATPAEAAAIADLVVAGIRARASARDADGSDGSVSA